MLKYHDEELKKIKNGQEIQMLNAKYNQLHRLDKYDMAISAATGMLGAAVDILLVGIPQKTPEAGEFLYAVIFVPVGQSSFTNEEAEEFRIS